MTPRAHLARTWLCLDPRGLGVFRILLGCVLALDQGLRGGGGTLAAGLMTALFALVYLGLALGWRTPLMQVGALIAHTSLIARVAPLRHGGDVLLQLLLVLTALLPLGRRFSLDALLRSFRERVEHVADDLDFAVRPTRSAEPVVTLAALGLVLQLFALVAFSCATASEHTQAAGSSTQMVEALLATLLFVPLRMLGPRQLNALGRAFARGRPRLRCFFDSDCGICFLIARLLARLDVFDRIELRSNHEHDALPSGVRPELVEHTIVVAELDRERVYLHSEAIARLFLALPLGALAFAVMRMPGLRAGFERLYEQVARNRRTISVSLGLAACGVPVRRPELASDAASEKTPRSRLRAPIVARELALALLLLALTSEALAVNPAVPAALRPPRPALQRALIHGLGLYQDWTWLAPGAPRPSRRSDSALGRDHAPGSARARSR